MLTDLKRVFRSLKSELGLRPVYNQKKELCNGHLFITVLAYQCVQTLTRCAMYVRIYPNRKMSTFI